MTGTNQVTTFSDIFKNSFMKLLPTTVDPWTLVLSMLLALAVGIGIFLVYRKCFLGVVYDHAFNLSLVIMTVAFGILFRLKGGDKTYVLVVNYDTSMELEEEIRRALGNYKTKLRSKIVKNGITEMTVEVYLKVENVNLTNQLSVLEGVHDVTLVQYRGNYEL